MTGMQTEPRAGLNTAMAAAFAVAGYKAAEPPEKRLMRRAIREGDGIEARVLAAFERLLPASADARLIRAVIGDELFRSAVCRLFRDTYNEIRRAQAAGRPAVSEPAIAAVPKGQDMLAEPQTAPKAAPAGAIWPMPKGQEAGAPAAAAVPVARASRVSHAGRIALARNSLLRRIAINGRALADVTAGEARRWLQTQQRDCHFVRLLVQPMQDGMRFADCYRDEGELATIWRRAQEMTDAAG